MVRVIDGQRNPDSDAARIRVKSGLTPLRKETIKNVQKENHEMWHRIQLLDATLNLISGGNIRVVMGNGFGDPNNRQNMLDMKAETTKWRNRRLDKTDRPSSALFFFVKQILTKPLQMLFLYADIADDGQRDVISETLAHVFGERRVDATGEAYIVSIDSRHPFSEKELNFLRLFKKQVKDRDAKRKLRKEIDEPLTKGRGSGSRRRRAGSSSGSRRRRAGSSSGSRRRRAGSSSGSRRRSR